MIAIKEGSTVPLKYSNGEYQLLIVGNGSATIKRSVGGSKPYPLTDGGGDPIEFSGTSEDDVLFNGELSSASQRVRFFIECTSGEVEYEVAND